MEPALNTAWRPVLFLHEEKGCWPNPLELDSDTGGPGHSQQSMWSRARARRLGPFLGRRGLGEFCSGFLGPHAGFGRPLAGLRLPVCGPGGRAGWLESAEQTPGRWGSERRLGAYLFRAELVGRGQAPWSRLGVCWLCPSEKRGLPAHVDRLGRSLEPWVSLLITW